MRALLLAAGFGTRLRPLTEHTPKCLVPVNGRPLLDYWLEALWDVGFTEFIVNTHYLPDKVRDFVEKHRLRKCISLIHEKTLLGTAGTLLANRDFLESGTTLVAHADNLCLCSWKDFVSAHFSRPSVTIMSMMTFLTANPRDCGVVEIDSSGIVRGFHEKVSNPPSNLANAAVYLIEPEVVHYIAKLGNDIQDISNQVIPRMMGKIYTWCNTDVLVDIGTPERLSQAHEIAQNTLRYKSNAP